MLPTASFHSRAEEIFSVPSFFQHPSPIFAAAFRIIPIPIHMFHSSPFKWLISITLVLALQARAFAGESHPVPADSTHVSTSDTHAGEGKHATSHEKEEGFNAGKMIMHHISDSHEWEFFSVKKRDGSLWTAGFSLPLFLFTPGEGFQAFSYSKIHHGETYKGFTVDADHHLVRADGKKFYDFSITKNVLQLLIAVSLMLLIFISAAKKYSKAGVKAPRGLQSAVEVLVMFIRDEVAKPMLGERADKFLPYLLTLFFFIWINNLMGLIPGAANVTGNIAVTAVLALLTFILMMVFSKSGFWKHMVKPPGVPPAALIILVPIEFISNLIVKPFALMIRLFANMLAGHLIVLSFMSMIFIFAAMNLAAGIGASVFSIAFSIFIYLLELLVAALQAYIFTILTALFISETGISDHSAEEHH
jgi:F-type H+-transporting ATPase subunit a